jgi:hypothetical protein
MKDLRVPIGAFFVMIGGLLVAVPGARAPLTAAPVNLYAGLTMLIFGGVMLWLGLRRGST